MALHEHCMLLVTPSTQNSGSAALQVQYVHCRVTSAMIDDLEVPDAFWQETKLCPFDFDFYE